MMRCGFLGGTVTTSMPKKILVINGHPDPSPQRFDHALADSYFSGAREAGHDVRRVAIAEVDFPWLKNGTDFYTGRAPSVIVNQQELLRWAEHVVLIYPLWLGAMPALLKAYLEQVLRPGFAFAEAKGRGLPKGLLVGRSVRIFVTMGMPALFYTMVYRAHSLKSLERNILGFVGFKPIRATVIGNIEGVSAKKRQSILAEAAELGTKGE
jgi:putative NADPH-quinone reductase